MRTTVQIPCTALLAFAMAGLAGCASVNTKPSGFLGSYDGMKPTKPGGEALVYRDGTALVNYHAVIIESVTFQTNAAARLSLKSQAKLGDKLTGCVRNVFGSTFTIATEPGSGVLRLRTTVNDINKSSPVVNLVTTAAVFLPFDMGAVSVEMEAVDSISGRRIAALMDKRQGSPFTPAGVFASFAATGHACTGFNRLAKTMLEVLSNPQPQRAPLAAVPIDQGLAATEVNN